MFLVDSDRWLVVVEPDAGSFREMSALFEQEDEDGNSDSSSEGGHGVKRKDVDSFEAMLLGAAEGVGPAAKRSRAEIEALAQTTG